MKKPPTLYRMSEGVYLRYNVRMCFGCNQRKPKDKRPASKAWRCADCRAAAKGNTTTSTGNLQ